MRGHGSVTRLRQCQQRLHVDPRRREERVVEQTRLDFRCRRRLRRCEQLAYQRVAVRVRTGGGQADDHIARSSAAAVDDGVLLDDADTESREVVVPVRVHARHFSRLAADQSRSRLHAALDDAFDHRFGDFDAAVLPWRSSRGRKAARHPARPRRSRTSPRDRSRSFRGVRFRSRVAAWCPHRRSPRRAPAAITADRQLEQSAEAAEAREHFRAHRTLDGRLDAFDEFIAGFDVDAGIFVGDRLGGGHRPRASAVACVILHAAQVSGPASTRRLQHPGLDSYRSRSACLRTARYCYCRRCRCSRPRRAPSPSPIFTRRRSPSSTTRDAAFVDALKSVAVRVSGQRDAGQRLGRAHWQIRGSTCSASAFAADGTLEVAFDSGSVDRMLSDAGLPIWGRERPATLVLLDVQDPGGSSRWLALDSPDAEREAIARAARQRGLPIIWPSDRPQVGAFSDTTSGIARCRSQAITARTPHCSASARETERADFGALDARVRRNER